MGLGHFVREHMLYLGSCLGDTATVMPPRWKFFEDVSGFIPAGTEAMAEFGPGSGRLMEMVVAQRKLLAENGAYIAVDCNNAFLDFIRRDRPHLADDARVHLVHERAQSSRAKLEQVLQGRKLGAVAMSFPFSFLSEAEIAAVWETVKGLSTKETRVIVYNVHSTRQMLLRHCREVHTKKVKDAHYYLPPAFELNVGFGMQIPEPASVTGKPEVSRPPLSLGKRNLWRRK